MDRRMAKPTVTDGWTGGWPSQLLQTDGQADGQANCYYPLTGEAVTVHTMKE